MRLSAVIFAAALACLIPANGAMAAESVLDGYTAVSEISYASGTGVDDVSADYEITTDKTDRLVGYIAQYDSDGVLCAFRGGTVIPENGRAELSIRMTIDSDAAKSGTLRQYRTISD